MFQEITIIGNVGQEPQVRTTTTGKQVANFSVAVNERAGEQDKTTWFGVVAWNKLADVMDQHLHKGQLVMVKGTVSIKTWQDKNGDTRASMEINADKIKFLGGKPE
ncbi:MAG: single-stranded DNA-binding protein [Chloroflexi bacterium]|nr:single-stranded DNA-binding protein [Chloroflexota bacterium]